MSMGMITRQASDTLLAAAASGAVRTAESVKSWFNVPISRGMPVVNVPFSSQARLGAASVALEGALGGAGLLDEAARLGSHRATRLGPDEGQLKAFTATLIAAATPFVR